MTHRTLLPLFASLAVGSALVSDRARGQEAPPDYVVRFLDRTIDLRPYVQGFPYSGWNADFESQQLFYFHLAPQGRFLMVQPLRVGRGSGPVDPTAGRRVHDIDWAKRNFAGMAYDSVSRDIILMADERNDEVFNLYRLTLADGSLEKLTDVPYIYGWAFSKDHQWLGYIARFGTTEPYRNCLRVVERKTATSRDVLCEQGSEHRMVWSTVNFRPDGKGAVLRVNRNGHRKQGNFAHVDLTKPDPAMEILLPDGPERMGLGTFREWIDDDRFYYVSDETGFANLYVFDLKARTAKALTAVTEEASFRPIDVDARKLVVVSYNRPHETEMRVIDPATGAELGRRTFDSSIGVIGFDDKNHFVVAHSSAASPFRADEMWITLENGRAQWVLEPKIRLPRAYADAVEQCNVERVSYPTFDRDAKTGQTRMLHAYVLTPKRPRPDSTQRLAVITAFYGGGNVFDTRAQIYCEAGIAWLSPAVRGSSGFGKEFMALNDRDLGGDEIIDLFYGARFLERKLGLEARRIGVVGGSHGGFATMRALTFPPSTNGRNESYDFGFGMSHAGFSSIASFYSATNIPDWIILEAGDPKTERVKLLDRSPLTHANRLSAPLLLTHGSNDNRVGVTESRQFYEAAKQLNKPVTYIEFEGQGHGIQGLANLVRYYRAQFEFLEEVLTQRRVVGATQRP